MLSAFDFHLWSWNSPLYSPSSTSLLHSTCLDLGVIQFHRNILKGIIRPRLQRQYQDLRMFSSDLLHHLLSINSTAISSSLSPFRSFDTIMHYYSQCDNWRRQLHIRKKHSPLAITFSTFGTEMLMQRVQNSKQHLLTTWPGNLYFTK